VSKKNTADSCIRQLPSALYIPSSKNAFAHTRFREICWVAPSNPSKVFLFRTAATAHISLHPNNTAIGEAAELVFYGRKTRLFAYRGIYFLSSVEMWDNE
jgi:hypothetical protein